jgi:hypothetical protein
MLAGFEARCRRSGFDSGSRRARVVKEQQWFRVG